MRSKKEQSWSLYDTPPNEDVCSLVEYGKKVLDVGCATGRIAEKLKKEKKCFVVGIEVNQEMARIAKKRCDSVIVANAEELKDINYPNAYFDIILFADVLEHCRNPENILQNFKKYLSKNGYVLISLPNTVNWEIRLKFLLGKFDYKGGTILDTGHLKFFTLKSASEMIERADFRITKVMARNIHLNLLGKLWKNLFAWGFVFKAEKV